jgi:hypothetical protein
LLRGTVTELSLTHNCSGTVTELSLTQNCSGTVTELSLTHNYSGTVTELSLTQNCNVESQEIEVIEMSKIRKCNFSKYIYSATLRKPIRHRMVMLINTGSLNILPLIQTIQELAF